jgi:hypothetical protein
MLWADAVCINQVDKDEKARHIPLMGSIYKNASSVLAWLGEGRESARKAVAECKVLDGLAKMYHVEPEEYDFKVFTEPKLKLPAASQGSKKLPQDATGSGQNIEVEELRTLGPHNVTVSETKGLQANLESINASGLHEFVDIPWFSRLWIIQEVANTQRTTLHYGHDELE